MQRNNSAFSSVNYKHCDTNEFDNSEGDNKPFRGIYLLENLPEITFPCLPNENESINDVFYRIKKKKVILKWRQ